MKRASRSRRNTNRRRNVIRSSRSSDSAPARGKRNTSVLEDERNTFASTARVVRGPQLPLLKQSRNADVRLRGLRSVVSVRLRPSILRGLDALALRRAEAKSWPRTTRSTLVAEAVRELLTREGLL